MTLGIVSIDDRAPEGSSRDNSTTPKRAHIAISRIQKDLGKESTLGVLFGRYIYGNFTERTVSEDTRLKLSPNWIAIAQAVGSLEGDDSSQRLLGRSYLTELENVGRHFALDTIYSDSSPRFHAQLGLVPRVDLKQVSQWVGYQWHPESGAVLGFGPVLSALADWNHAGQLQDWQLNMPFSLQFKHSTSLTFGREEIFERYRELPFRQNATDGTFNTELLNWASLDLSFVRGTSINYFPTPGSLPSLARSIDAGIGLAIRPTSRIRFVESYLFNQLHELREGNLATPRRSIFNDHVLSTRISAQFTRTLSLRTIIDYNRLIANPALVYLERTRTRRTDTLLTYMLSPGTAHNAGYSNRFENLTFEANQIQHTNIPTNQPGDHASVKISYTFRPR